ncbi:type II secretion system protein [Opitutaceae bacterium TAV4]|nr:type II secretion system protein [Opitutaceae bacterium TAV4]RRJ99629.1 type II secretion system protein [Opitutaceae bacterium TAV3]
MNSTNRRTQIRPRAFTLIELLTVIAIIGILSALVITGISGARKSARRAQCVSNERQLLAAAHLYANDNKETLPRPWNLLGGIHPTNPDKYKGIITLLLLYSGDDKRLYYCPDAASARTGGGINQNTYEYQLIRTDGEAYHQTGYYWTNSENFSSTKHTLSNGSTRRVLITCPTVQNGYLGMHGGLNNMGFLDGHIQAYKKAINNGSDIDATTLELKLP